MPKRIREYEDIYIAPDILGIHRNGRYLAIDERKNIELNPRDVNHKIYIYERQVKDWFLNRATKFTRGRHNGFIVLMLCMSYLEGTEQYKEGSSSHRRSQQVFKQAVHRLYPQRFTDNNLTRLYQQSRNGLFHNGMVSGDIIINNDFIASMEFLEQDIKINPKKLLSDIKNDFKSYIQALYNENNIDMRRNFDQMFSVIP
jgi:hypothetical protein